MANSELVLGGGKVSYLQPFTPTMNPDTQYAYEDAYYCYLENDLVYIEIKVTHPTGVTGSITTHILTLPDNLKPSRRHSLTVTGIGLESGSNAFRYGCIYIVPTSGNMYVQMSGSTKTFYINGVYSLK